MIKTILHTTKYKIFTCQYLQDCKHNVSVLIVIQSVIESLIIIYGLLMFNQVSSASKQLNGIKIK